MLVDRQLRLKGGIAWSAPGVQTLPYGTSAPKDLASAGDGRLYVSVISVVATALPDGRACSC